MEQGQRLTVAELRNLNTAEVAARESEVMKLRNELQETLRNEVDSDAEWTDQRKEQYKNTARDYETQGKNLDILGDALKAAHSREERKPQHKLSAMARALHAKANKGDALQGLESWEADRFMPVDRQRGEVPEKMLGARQGERDFGFKMEFDESAGRDVPEFYNAPQQSDTADSKRVVPHSTSMRVHERLVYFGNVQANTVEFNTSDGNPHYELYRDATATQGRVLNKQGLVVSKKDPAVINSIEFGALDITSDELPIAKRFITDMAADIQGLVRREGLRSIASAWNSACVKQPTSPADENLSDVQQGLIGLAAGNTRALAAKDAITWPEIKAWYNSLPYDLRVRTEGNPLGFRDDMGTGGLVFLMDSTLYDRIFDLDDDDGRPLAQPIPGASIASGPAYMIRGVPMVVNNGFDSMASGAQTGAVPGVFMNGNKFSTRTVGSVWVNFHFDSRTDQSNSVSYIMWDRRFFAPNNEISAGNGVNDATRSRAVARLTLP